MVNKLWYLNDCGTYNLVNLRNDLQEIIDLYCSDIFHVPEDITIDNFQIFLERILKHYEYYHFNSLALADLAEVVVEYFSKYYKDEFPGIYFPHYPETDRRQLVLGILHKLNNVSNEIFPEDVPFIIQFLNVSDSKIADTHTDIYNYLDQFDMNQRMIEMQRRYKVLDTQRIKAIESNQPIPIKPMGIKLYPCYKRKDIDWLMVRTAGPEEFVGKANHEASCHGHYPQLLDGSIYDPDIHDVKTIYEKKL